MTKKVLGKGLTSLVPDTYIDEIRRESQAFQSVEILPGVQEVEIDLLQAGGEQPRKFFADNSLAELAASIKEKGILQPLIVHKISDDRYEIICGERRFRAAKLAELKTVPVVIKDLVGNDALEAALIENIQREDLNPIEEAKAYEKLQNEGNYTHDQIAKKVGKDRATVSNAIRILKLPIDILDLVVGRKLSGGHARALLGIPHEQQQRFMAQKIASENLSVRQTEKLVQQGAFKKRKAKEARRLDAEIVNLETLIQQKLGTKVRVFSGKKNNGRLEITYNSLAELDRILEKMGVYRD